MRILRGIVAIIATSVVFSLSAQVATDSGLQSTTTTRSAPPPGTAAEPTIPERSEIDEIFKQTSLGKEADERRLHLEWRQLANRIVHDPVPLAAKRDRVDADTDFGKPQRLRAES